MAVQNPSTKRLEPLITQKAKILWWCQSVPTCWRCWTTDSQSKQTLIRLKESKGQANTQHRCGSVWRISTSNLTTVRLTVSSKSKRILLLSKRRWNKLSKLSLPNTVNRHKNGSSGTKKRSHPAKLAQHQNKMASESIEILALYKAVQTIQFCSYWIERVLPDRKRCLSKCELVGTSRL